MALTHKAIDTMKASRDSGSWTNQQKIDHCNAIVQFVPDLTHISIDCYTNNTGYQSYAYVREWADAVHNTGKKIWWRPAFIVAYVGEEPTLEEYYTSIMEGPSANSNWFATGDIFELQPETNPYIGVLTGDAQSITDWNAWLRDKSTAAEAVFAGMGKTVDCKIVTVTDGYAKQGTAILSQATITHMNNRICYDSYPMDSSTQSTTRKVQGLMGDISIVHAAYPTADIILGEIGYNNLSSVSDENQREVLRLAFNALSGLSYIKGINYWVGFNNNGGGQTQLFQMGSRTLPRPALKTLSEFYTKGVCSGRQDVI